MKRRLLMVAGMAALLVATTVPATSMARGSERFGEVAIGGRKARLDRLPSQGARDRFVNVAVQLAGRPVAAYQGAALAAGEELSAARKADLRAIIGRRQAITRSRIVDLGGRVEYTYTDVFNGFRIRVRANRLRDIAALPGVRGILAVPRHTRSNANTIGYIGATKTWTSKGFTGKGVSIAIIDSGINYYHEGFGGAGFQAWRNDNGLTRGDDFPTAKVIAGYDLVGDDYDAGDDFPIIEPDNDPLDCKAADAGTVQHGTHVAGTAAGLGVASGGQTYSGPYTTAAVRAADLRIAPGVAPEAKLMAFRVFGCDGSTLVTADAIELAVRAGADVINMSLGSTFGNPGSLDAVASDNASLAGTVVVASSGNEGSSAYVTGSPGSSLRTITVAAMDAQRSFPSASIDMATGGDIPAINANDAALPVTGRLVHFKDDPSTQGDEDTGEGFEQSGCTASSYAYNDFPAGRIAVVQRGFCARIDKAKAGQQADARAVIQVNNASGLPPFENAIAGVTIPFIGVSGDVDGRFDADDGKSVTITSTGVVDNATFKYISDFTSYGPGRVRNLVKPDITAPGVSVFSVDGSTVAQGKTLSGTSMAAPAVAGVAALVIQANPRWSPRAVKAAIVGTAASGRVKPYEVRAAGAGLVQPLRAVDTKAYVVTEPGSSSITFGYQPAPNRPGTSVAFSETRDLTIVNTSSRAITYDLSNDLQTAAQGLSASLSRSSVTVPAKSQRTVTVSISLSEAAARALPASAPDHAAPIAVDVYGNLFTDVPLIAGRIIVDPRGGGAGIYELVVPWQVIPRGESRIQEIPESRAPWTAQGDLRRSSIAVRNYGVHRGIADVYAWGLVDNEEGLDGIDMRAAGVQSVIPQVCDPGAAENDRCLIFAVNLWGTFNNASENEYDVLIDVDNDGNAEYVVASVDLGLVFGTFFGITGSIIIDLQSGDLVNAYFAGVGTNGSTVLLPVLASDLGLRPRGDTGFRYWAESYEVYDDDGLTFQFDLMTTGLTGAGTNPTAQFDAFDPAFSNGAFKGLKPTVQKRIPLAFDQSRYQPKTRGHKGWMIVSLDDANGRFQADLVPVGPDPS